MKIIGAILIIISTTWVGFEFAKRLSERPRQLRQLKVALQSLEAEIMYGLTPLAEASLNIAKQMPQPLSSFFLTFAEKLETCDGSALEAWKQSLKETWHLTSLCKGEYEVMTQFGSTLGQSDREQQQKQILLALTHLEREEVDAKEIQHRYEKMLKSLGFLGGLLVVILMM